MSQISPETEALEKAALCERLSFPPDDDRHITIDKLLREYAEVLRAGVAQTPAVPDGYVLVPRKITIAMIAAGWAAFRRDKPPVQLLGPGKGFVEAWEAMLDAADTSTVGKGWSSHQ